MNWALPWAGALAIAVVLPLVAHLWSRRQPTLRPFSTLRFLRASSPVARRLQRVQDWPLLALRAAIVLLIVAAAAGPTVVTAGRLDAWRSRLHRVIVVETSAAANARSVVGEWQRTASSSEVLTAAAPMQALADASARATVAARESRTEIALAWSGRATALPPRALDAVPGHVGLRFAPIDAPARPAVAVPLSVAAAPGDAAVAARLRETATRLASRSEVAVRVNLPGSPSPDAAAAPATSGAAMLLDALATDPRIREAAERSRPDARSVRMPAAARLLAADAQGRPLLAGWAEGNRVELLLSATPGSPLALWSVLVASEALARPEVEQVPMTWSAADLARLTRDGKPPTANTLPAGLDTRWCWALALLLLVGEQWWRRGARDSREPAVEARDAA